MAEHEQHSFSESSDDQLDKAIAMICSQPIPGTAMQAVIEAAIARGARASRARVSRRMSIAALVAIAAAFVVMVFFGQRFLMKFHTLESENTHRLAQSNVSEKLTAENDTSDAQRVGQAKHQAGDPHRPLGDDFDRGLVGHTSGGSATKNAPKRGGGEVPIEPGGGQDTAGGSGTHASKTRSGGGSAGSSVVAVANSSNRFAIDLYAKLAVEEDGNLFFSPSSISTALAMAYAGTRGDTAAEMAKVLHLNHPSEDLHTNQAALLKLFNDPGTKRGYQLSIANRLWGQKGYPFLASFLRLLNEDYRADLVQLDFAQPEVARYTINAWIAHATNGKIKEIIGKQQIDKTTRLVLTNAVYFHGDWEYPFDSTRTKQAAFSLSAEEKIDVPLMYHEALYKFGQVSFANKKGMKVLELPYQGQDVSMVVLLPDDVDGLTGLENRLTAENLKQWTARLDRRDVEVWLPQFKMTSEFQLKEALTELGMPSAFMPRKADFSGIDGSRDLWFTAAIHKAYVEVNEQGTEAAAATALTAKGGPQSFQFRADHPFVFLIRHNQSGCILFLGRVIDPSRVNSAD